jgi:spermidine synthase
MNPFTLFLSAFMVGFSSMIGQIVLMRELMVAFYGNELSLGITLGAWLMWGGVGSWALGKTADSVKDKIRAISFIQILIPIILIISILAARNVKSLFNLTPGQIMGIPPMIGSAFLVLSLYCMSLGYLFVLVARTIASVTGRSSAGIGRAYLSEGLGASVGGLLAGLILIKTLNPFEITAVVGASSLLIVLILQARTAHRSFASIGLSLLLLIALAYVLLSGALDRLNRTSSAMQWRGMNLEENRNSLYGNIVVTSYDSQYNFFENGLWIFTSGDRLSAEEGVHYVMLEHPNPKRVLLIGGGLNGSGNEVLKHKVEKLVYIELDPMLVQIARRYLKEEMNFLDDPRVELIHTDARFFIKRTMERFDVVIVNLPDPHTAMLNRFYSLEFFTEVKRVLNPGGIVSLSLTSSENYLSYEQRGLLRSIRRTMLKVFSEAVVLPGGVNFVIGKLPDNWRLTLDPGVLVARLKERKAETLFVSEYYIPYRLTPDRVSYLKDILERPGRVRLNRDFHPIGYFYDMILWSSQFKQRTEGGKFVAWIAKVRTWHLAVLIVLISTIAFTLFGRFGRRDISGIVLSIGTTGFSEISFQVVVMLAFQVLYGYVYYKLSIILTSFMIGLVFGSWAVSRWMDRFRDRFRVYLWVQLSISLYPLTLAFVIAALARFGGGRPAFLSVQTAFSFLPVLAGFIGGFQFPLANDIILKRTPQVGKVVGLLYGVDLFGSCVGAFLTSVFLIPLLGVYNTCLLTAVLGFCVLGWLALSARYRAPLHDLGHPSNPR